MGNDEIVWEKIWYGCNIRITGDAAIRLVDIVT